LENGSKNISELVDDIYALFGGHECNPANVEEFGRELSRLVADRLGEHRGDRAATLRMSNLGRPDRQLWYEINGDGGGEEFPPHVRIKFLYGDILEALLLFLAKEAGHTVELAQAEVEIDGIVGHNDAVIDGVVVDVKSASTFSFKKFKDGSLREDDPFGYMEQLAGYSAGLGGLDGAFLAIDKTLGHLTLMQVPRAELFALDIPGRIKHIKGVLANPEVPERCYAPVDMGASGNQKLDTGCSYCSHKFKCWSDANDGIGLRSFLYSSGPVHLTTVVKEPNVIEVTF